MPTIALLNPEHAHLCAQIWRELGGHYDYPVGGDWSENKIQTELRDHHGIGIFSQPGELEAFCLFRSASKVLEIMCLATRIRQHRSGAMRSLIRSLIQDLAQDEVIWLEVHAGNLPAISLYESLGFQLCGERPNYYRDGSKALLFEYKPLQ